MITPRVIPALLLRDKGLVKGTQFKDYRYVGDPMNAVKIFNEKEVDELFFLDITATNEKRCIPVDFVQQIADECYMPFGVGGGITSVQEIRDILKAGAEKVSINSAAVENPALLQEAAEHVGNQSIVVSIDVKKKWSGSYGVFTSSGTKKTSHNPVEWAKKAEGLGAGEILLNCIDTDGSMQGYNIELIKMVTESVSVPVIACGGAGNLQHLADAVAKGNASAVAAGSFFVFHGRRRAVLINFPTQQELADLFGTNTQPAIG